MPQLRDATIIIAVRSVKIIHDYIPHPADYLNNVKKFMMANLYLYKKYSYKSYSRKLYSRKYILTIYIFTIYISKMYI